jgi:hypothetical protein
MAQGYNRKTAVQIYWPVVSVTVLGLLFGQAIIDLLATCLFRDLFVCLSVCVCKFSKHLTWGFDLALP